MSAATNIAAAIESLAEVIAEQTAAWAAAGQPQSWSINGVSVSWGGWLSEKVKALTDLQVLQQQLQGPFVTRSRHRG